MELIESERDTILAAVRNGLGLTHGCRGIRKSPKDISQYIRENQAFELQCNMMITQGYQTLLSAMNDAINKQSWDKWKNHRVYIDNFITEMGLWENFCTPDKFSFVNFTMAIRKHRTIEEVATVMGMPEQDLILKVYEDPTLVQWLMQNGFQI